ncbi:MAG: 2-oxoglutarate dehydrogenase complex dihydrolipoyllysine-residue succinyltransferase, partial [Shewanella sp.]
IGEFLFQEGDTVLGEQVIAKFIAGAVSGQEVTKAEAEAEAAAPVAAAATEESNDALSPSVRRLLAEHNVDASKVKGTGVGGRITKEDVEAFIKSAPKAAAAPATPAVQPLAAGRSEKRVPMTRLRKTIANRLLEAKNSTAMLTTFNEVNMKPIMDIRKQYQDIFEKRHGIRLGFMSFYVKAVTEALKRFPAVNASIDGDDIVYHNYFDVSIAVSTPRGLVTPVLRDTDTMSLADIEKAVRDLAIKGRDGKLTVADMTGGNFTVTNGGVFGSLMSTPILNLPQSAILGMHAIKDRPMAVNGQVEILPMMYLALSYDHRIVDGRESVGFLVAIKDFLEDPTRLLLDL